MRNEAKDQDKWGWKDVAKYLERVAWAETYLPPDERRHFFVKTNMPEYVREWFKGSAKFNGETARLYIRPSPEQIEQINTSLDWFAWLVQERDERTAEMVKIMWSFAKGYSKRQVAYATGYSPTKCYSWNRIGLESIAGYLNRTGFEKPNYFY